VYARTAKKAAGKAPARGAPKAAKKTAVRAPAGPAKTATAAKTGQRAAKAPVAKAPTAAKEAPAAKAAPAAKGAAAKGAPAAKTAPAAKGAPARAAAPVGPTAPVDPATLHLTAAPVLHRILTCHVPVAAIARLEATGESVFAAARHALQAGIKSLEQELASEKGASTIGAAAHERPSTRPLAVPAGLAAALLVTRLAQESFEGDVHVAGGWLIARGAGLPVALPLPEGAATRRAIKAALQRLATPEKVRSRGGVAAAASGGRVSAPLILVPAGPQLRAMREALGVSREKVAAAAGVTPDTVGEIERDRRPTAAARLQVAEVLCGLNPSTRLAA